MKQIILWNGMFDQIIIKYAFNRILKFSLIGLDQVGVTTLLF